MKLRLGSPETKETTTIEVPTPCSLFHLRELIYHRIDSSSIHLSLNLKDELLSSSPQDSLHSLGISPGDLIFFTLNPNAFSPQTLTLDPPNSQKPSQFMDSGGTEAPSLDTQKDEALGLNIQTELSNDCDRHYKQFVIAVHAVMLESGFVGIDPVSKTAFTKSFSYTLPQIIDFRGVDTVVLKFQTLGRFCNVYGCLANGKGAHWVTLDEDQISPFLNFAGVQVSVKDKLALPLLIDLCEKCGLNLPLCFMSLPTEIKLKILESLPGVEIANVACVCSELRNLASSDYLWKQKFVEQFGDDVAAGGENWEEKFAKSWESRKRRKIYGHFASYAVPAVHICRPDDYTRVLLY